MSAKHLLVKCPPAMSGFDPTLCENKKLCKNMTLHDVQFLRYEQRQTEQRNYCYINGKNPGKKVSGKNNEEIFKRGLLLLMTFNPHGPFTQQMVVPWLEFFLGGEPPPRLPNFIRVVHTTGGRPLIGHSILTVNNSWMTVLKMLVTEKQPPLTLTHLRQNVQYLNSLYVTVLHRKMTKSQPLTTPLVTVVRNSYAHAQNHLLKLTVSKSEAEILNSLGLAR